MFLFPAIFKLSYLCRISVEERMLAKELGDNYFQYWQRTRKLLPFPCLAFCLRSGGRP